MAEGAPKDPTENVRALLEAAVTRIDDLRLSETKRIDEALKVLSENAAALREAEAKRIDAIRAVDVGAVGVANERATAQAAVLANQVAASADALRALVAATATTVAVSLQQLSTQLTDRLSLLEKSQYENKGKSGVSTPLLAVLATIAGGVLVYVVERALAK